MTELTVYTALFGRHEILQPQPAAAESDARWVCFTDDPELVSDDWEVVLVEPAFPTDPVRSARRVKILGPVGIDTNTSLWIDNRVTLTRRPESFVGDLLAAADIAVFAHSFHDTLLDEFVAVAEGAYDDPTRVHEQLFHYARSPLAGDALLGARPYWSGFLARRRSPQLDAAMRTWWEHVLRYSRRDQLALPFALATSTVTVNALEGDNRVSDFHEWPRISRRLGRTENATLGRLLLAPLEELKRTSKQLIAKDEEYQKALARLKADVEEAHGRARRAERRAQETTAELEEAREVAGAQRRAAGRARRRAETLEAEVSTIGGLHDQLRVAEERASAATAERDELRGQLEEIRGSRAWRLVTALRRGR